MPKKKEKPSLRNVLVDALAKRATIVLKCEDEDIPYVGNCSAIDPETDRKQEQWIRDQLASGNEWAWCSTHVRATYRGFVGDDYLGGCSYLSEEDFVKTSMYYGDMVRTACGEIADQLIKAGAIIEELTHPRKLTCAGDVACTSRITHIDNKGWTYCTQHGVNRQVHVPCRKMTKTEVETLQRGETISYRRKS